MSSSDKQNQADEQIQALIETMERAISQEGSVPEEGFSQAILRSAETLHISTDFVEICVTAASEDRQLIESEAAKVDEIELSREVLDAYGLPATSPDFVTHTHRLVQADRQAHQAEWRRLLHSYRVPKPSRDFVERTFTALSTTGAAPVLAGPGSFGRRVAAAAAAVLLAVGLNLALVGTKAPMNSERVSLGSSAQDSSPVPWGTALERRNGIGFSFEAIDSLQVLTRITEDE